VGQRIHTRRSKLTVELEYLTRVSRGAKDAGERSSVPASSVTVGEGKDERRTSRPHWLSFSSSTAWAARITRTAREMGVGAGRGIPTACWLRKRRNSIPGFSAGKRLAARVRATPMQVRGNVAPRALHATGGLEQRVSSTGYTSPSNSPRCPARATTTRTRREGEGRAGGCVEYHTCSSTTYAEDESARDGEASGRGRRRRRMTQNAFMLMRGYRPSNAILRDLDGSGTTEAGFKCE
jgi:hypothetical protein